EWERLGVRVVDAEYAHAMSNPKEHDIAQCLPERDAVIAGEVRIDDVLVFLRRVLGEFDRAVRPMTEPLGMRFQPWMVRRALHREIERDFHLVGVAGGDQPIEVVERAELGMHSVMPTLLVADGIKAARIVWPGAQRIVFAFAIGAA